jgi:hypothetical protein
MSCFKFECWVGLLREIRYTCHMACEVYGRIERVEVKAEEEANKKRPYLKGISHGNQLAGPVMCEHKKWKWGGGEGLRRTGKHMYRWHQF